MSNHLAHAFPQLAKRLPHMTLADLPTPVSFGQVTIDGYQHDVLIKHDDVTGREYGGNKLRKLEYVLQQARDKKAKRIATLGGVGSNHAVATALYAKRAGFECSCLLFHQSLKPGLGNVLRFHLQNGTEIVRIGGNRSEQVAIMRKTLLGRRAWLVPLGGSSWQGTVGYVNAGLELAAQIEAGEIARPSRVYVALGTMGTAAGLALGLALAGLDIEVQAIRVTLERYSNESALRHLMNKTAFMMRRLDSNIPADLAASTRLVHRSDFFGGGYGRTNDATENAIAIARQDLGLTLESTYSGKTMAALLHDVRSGFEGQALFWNTYNSRPMHIDENLAPDFDRMPREFARYFET